MVQNSIFDDFENFGFLSKIWFFGILGGHWTLGDSGNIDFFGFWSILIFLFFLIFCFFLGGRKILAGGYGAVLVGVSIPPTQPCKEGARRSIFDDFEISGFLSKILIHLNHMVGWVGNES